MEVPPPGASPAWTPQLEASVFIHPSPVYAHHAQNLAPLLAAFLPRACEDGRSPFLGQRVLPAGRGSDFTQPLVVHVSHGAYGPQRRLKFLFHSPAYSEHSEANSLAVASGRGPPPAAQCRSDMGSSLQGGGLVLGPQCPQHGDYRHQLANTSRRFVPKWVLS